MNSRVALLWSLLRSLLCCSLLAAVLAAPASAGHPPPVGGGPVYRTQPGTGELPPRYALPSGPNVGARIAFWNEAAQRANAFDHAPAVFAGAARGAEQLGPTRTSRVMAIVQLAVYDALNAILRRYPGYSGALPALPDSSQDAAVAQAAHDTLIALYPRQAERFDAWLRADLARLPPGRATLNGIDVGRRAAAAILALRARDGSYDSGPVVGVDYRVSNAPGVWRPDPVSRSPIALGAYWQGVRPFVLQSSEQFRAPPPPLLGSEAYARAFDEVKQFGGDGVHTPTRRTLSRRWPVFIGPTTARPGSARRCACTTRLRCSWRWRAARTRSNWRACWPWSTWRWRTRRWRYGDRNTTTTSGAR
jgi:hypothetical protein